MGIKLFVWIKSGGEIDLHRPLGNGGLRWKRAAMGGGDVWGLDWIWNFGWMPTQSAAGHSASSCRNPKRCGRCWAFGHIGSKCKTEVVAPPPPARQNTKMATRRQEEPGFEELLTGNLPILEPEMPKDRQIRLHCFIHRDEAYYKELQRLKQGVVMYTSGFQWDLSVDNVASYACRTNLVKREEIQISELNGSRFLIMLPEGLDPDTFINATPQSAWDEGLSFQPWTPLEGAEISVPAYKVLLRLVGVPAHLWREKHIINAVNRFGVYLGTVVPEDPASIASWIVAVGVDDLMLVPTQLAMHDGGMVHPIQVYTLAWHRNPIYNPDDMPKQPKKYVRLQPPPSSSSSSDDDFMQEQFDLVPMSSRVLRELCKGRPADTLPTELRRFATLEEINMDNPFMGTQDSATIDQQLPYQNPPQKKQKESERSDFQQAKSPENIQTNAVAGGQNKLIKPPHVNHSEKSHRRLALGSVLSKETNQVVTALIGPGKVTESVPEPSSNIPPNSQPLQEIRRIQPHKILPRGQNFGNIMPPVRIRSETEELAQNQRNLLSNNTDNSKKTASVAHGRIGEHSNNDSAIIKKGNHVAATNDLHFTFQSKVKGPLAKTGPYSSKYKWVRPTKHIPINNAQNTKKVMTAQKRKLQQGPTARQVNKSAVKEKIKEGADISFNPEGFYEVRVDYGQIKKLATGCGFKSADIEAVIQTDNEDRRTQANIASSSKMGVVEEDPDLSRFELSSDDELSSEEEAF
ncbi:hypothetical protein FCM35_KLT14551 [Carex littledalei]|uniref:DUF4283 domain-containing protein n=1 Tax=Carex littledalei TaxID=544730 RepID=A0A833VF48_9POAL|nr:hypothetical protein FCM35_KLT14551 [Carex littledalei]